MPRGMTLAQLRARGMPNAKRRKTRRPIIIRKKANRQLATIGRVKRMIHAGRENKMVSHLVEYTQHNSPITNNDFYNVIPSIAQGTDENQRVGDKVQAKGLYIRGSVALYSDFAFNSNSPIRVRLFVLSSPWIKTASQVNANVNYLKLLRRNDDGGAADVLPYDGTNQNHILPVNKEAWKVLKDIQFTLCPENQSPPVSGTFQPLYAAHKFFNIKIPCPKTLSFDDNTIGTNYPVNFAPIMAIGYSYPDSAVAPDTTNVVKICSNFRSFLYYEDA